MPSTEMPRTEYAANLDEIRGAAPRPAAAEGPRTAGGREFRTVVSDQVSGLQVPSVPASQSAATAPSSRRRLFLLLGAIGMFLILLVVIGLVLAGGKSEKKAEAVAPATTTVAPTPEPPKPVELTATELAEQGNAKVLQLDVDGALSSWAAAIEKGAGDDVRGRLARTAFELGMAHLAAREPEKAKAYFEQAVKYGPENSPGVEAARTRLASM